MGDYAKGIDSGHIEVLVQGNEMNEEYLNNLATKGGEFDSKASKCLYCGREKG